MCVSTRERNQCQACSFNHPDISPFDSLPERAVALSAVATGPLDRLRRRIAQGEPSLESTSCERPDIRLSHVGCDCLAFLDRITIHQFTSEPRPGAARIVSDLSMSAITYGDLLQLGFCKKG